MRLCISSRTQAISRGEAAEAQWKKDCEEYGKKYPKEYAEFQQLISGECWDTHTHTHTQLTGQPVHILVVTQP